MNKWTDGPTICEQRIISRDTTTTANATAANTTTTTATTTNAKMQNAEGPIGLVKNLI